ncbi:hypothetical protein BSL78_16477, partial [Apostichopus japonicus]
SDQYELLLKEFKRIQEDINKHPSPSNQLIKERARVFRRLQKLNPKKGNHDRPSIARNLHTTRPEDEDHLIGLWKCKVKTELDKDKRLALARVFDIEASLIEGSPDPGLKLLEQIEKKDCQGCNWEAFAEALTDCGCLKALDTFLKHYKRSPPASVNHNPVSFQHMVADVEGMLNTSDALQIATCFGFNVRDIEETEKQGSQYVMKLLRDKSKFDFRNVTLLRKVLKKLDLIQAANRVGLEAIVFVCDKCVKLKELEELLKSCNCVWTEVGNSRAVSSAVAERVCCEVVPTCNGFDGLPVEELRDVDDGNEVSQEGNSEWLVVDEVRGDCDVIEDGSVVVNSGKWGQEKSKGRMVLCGIQ